MSKYKFLFIVIPFVSIFFSYSVFASSTATNVTFTKGFAGGGLYDVSVNSDGFLAPYTALKNGTLTTSICGMTNGNNYGSGAYITFVNNDCQLSAYKGKIKFFDSGTNSTIYGCYYSWYISGHGLINYLTSDENYSCPDGEQFTLWNLNGTMPPAGTCSDGIQNQDETGIDIGGVCGEIVSLCSTGVVYSGSYLYTPLTLSGGEIFTQTSNDWHYKEGPSIFDDSIFRITSHGDSESSTLFNGLYPDNLMTGTGTYNVGNTASIFSPYLLLEAGMWSTDQKTYSGSTLEPELLGYAFDYFIVRSTGQSTFKISYMPVLTNFDGHDYNGNVKEFDLTYRTNEHIKLPFATRYLKIIFEDGVYDISDIEVGTIKREYDYQQECKQFSQSDIATLSGQILDGVKTSLDVNEIVQRDETKQYQFYNPLLQPFYDKLQELIGKVGLYSTLNLLKMYVSPNPNMTFSFPLPAYSGGILTQRYYSYDLSNVEQHSSVLDDFAPATPTSNTKFLYTMFYLAVYIVFYCIVIGAVLVVWNLAYGLVDWVVGSLLPDGFGTSGNSNIFGLFTFLTWALFLAKVFVTFLPLLSIVFPVLSGAKDILLIIIKVGADQMGVWYDFQYWANIVVTTLITGGPLLMLYLFAKEHGHLN